jgi:uncharacterized protein (DUF433 family)
MASLNWSQCQAVESTLGKVSGAWVFTGTRTSVAIVFENLEDGMTIDEVMEQFPVTRGRSSRARVRHKESGCARAGALMRVLFDNGTPPPEASRRTDLTSLLSSS